MSHFLQLFPKLKDHLLDPLDLSVKNYKQLQLKEDAEKKRNSEDEGES